MELDQTLEKEADELAADYLIPKADMRRFSPTMYTKEEEIVAFAEEIGIYSGIVAGRLQHDGIIPMNRCAKLKEKYVISF